MKVCSGANEDEHERLNGRSKKFLSERCPLRVLSGVHAALMPDVGAFHQVEHLLADVGGVVGNTLE